jgi:mono/diheme cytochrome c family protein
MTLAPTILALVCVATSANDARAQPVDGGILFKTYCASCHGANGRGAGPVAVFLRVPPADLTLIARRNRGVFPAGEVYRIIDGRQAVKAHGNSEMPVWGDAFSRSITGGNEKAVVDRIKALVAFLDSIQERPAN